MVRFRAATPSDAPAIVPLVNAAYRGEGGWTTEAHLIEGARILPEELLAMMASADARFELAFGDDGALLGSVYLRREPGAVCYLGMLSVDPSSQANGVGRALMSHAEDVARGWGCERMRISVVEVRQELIAYYERRGFQPTGRAEPFPATKRSRPKIEGLRMVELVKELRAR